MSPEVEPLLPSDPTAFGGWKLLGRLGIGGFSTIFLGEKEGQFSAIKMIRKDLLGETNVFERFATEINNLEKLSHDGIAKLIDEDLSTEVPYIAMEYVQGETLEQYVLEHGPLPESEWFNILESVTATLNYCHSKGIVHKDIGPGNIMLSKTGPKIIDFGISYEQGSSRITQADQIVGTPSYMSPEHLSGQVTEAMDVFSLGATFAFAGTGLEPFASDSRSQTRTSITLEMPKLDGLSKLQRELIEPLLYKKANDRPRLSELLVAIKTFHANGTLGNYTSYSRGRTKKLVSRKIDPTQRRRTRNIYRAAIAIAVATVAFFGLFTFIFQSGILSNEAGDQLTTQCQTSLQNGNLDLAIETCTRAVAAGSKGANFLLARAHLAKGSDDQAELVLQGCKSQSLTCKSDYAYFFETGAKSLENLKSVNAQGDKDAAWRIGNYYQGKKDKAVALSWYQKASEAKNPIADIYLAIYWGDEKQYAKAINYAKRAINGDLTGRPSLVKIDHPVERLIESLFTKSGDSAGKIDFFTKCATEKVAFCISTVANTYLDNKDYENAKKWGLVGAEQQNAKSMWVLARVAAHKNSLLPKGTVDKAIDDEIMKWYKKAAELGDVQSSFSLGFFYAMGIGSLKTDLKESCSWYQKTMADVTKRKGTYREESTDQKDYSDASQFFLLQSCQTILLGENKLFNSPTPVAGTVKKSVKNSTSAKEITPLATSSSKDTTLAVASSDKFSLGSPLAQNVVKENIDGRVFKDGLNYWRIYLTNAQAEKVPPITGIQFKLIGFSNAEWLNTPYKLKKDSKVGVTNSWDGVYAEVDDLMFAFQFKNMKYCPEFRAIREENGKIVHIWSKGQPDCAMDYNP